MNRNRPKGLGRGLDALFGKAEIDTTGRAVSLGYPAATPLPIQHDNNVSLLKMISVDVIDVGGYQPRRNLDERSLEELAQSIRSHGVIQPLIVRPVLAGRYEIVAGERRWRAAMMVGLKDVPAKVEVLSDQKAASLALIENIQRDNLNPIEEALAIQRLIREFSMTHEQVAASIGYSRTATSNLLRLLNLSAVVQEYLQAGKVDMGHARALLPLPPEMQGVIVDKVFQQQLSVRQTEELVKKVTECGRKRPAGAVQSADRDVLRLQEDLADVLGATVLVRPQRAGGAIVQIVFADFDQMEALLKRLT